MKRDPEGVRRRILQAAAREFAERGYAGARVDRIALAARINKRMLYHYFGNKQNLHRAAAGATGDAVADTADPDTARLLLWWLLQASGPRAPGDPGFPAPEGLQGDPRLAEVMAAAARTLARGLISARQRKPRIRLKAGLRGRS